MTGYNHPISCTCGWCVNTGRIRINRSEVNASYLIHEAKSFLQRNGARSVAGCYVNPNAKCPVCGAAVFFYANAAGSRVYFDDLGPPWHKHPCTDNPTRRIREHVAFTGAPVRRAPGITYELVEAARTAGTFGNAHGKGGRWLLLVVVSVNRRGKLNTMLAEHLESDNSQRITVTCQSDAPMFEIGDFLSMRGNHFSYFDKASMQPVAFVNGGSVALDSKTATPEPTKPSQTPSIPKAILTRKPKSTEKLASRYDMTKQEMSHFHSKKKSVQQLCDGMLPIVRSYAKNGIRKPRQVAEMLNRDGHRTVSGARWTPRLTYFLLGLVFMPTERPTSDSRSTSSAKERSAPPPPSGPMTMEDMAAKLSQLGRVVLSE